MNLSPDFVVEQLKNSYNIYAPNKLSTAPCLIYTTLYIPGPIRFFRIQIISYNEFKKQ